MRLSPETIRCYRIALTQFFNFLQKEYDKVKSSDIRLWLISLEEQHLKPKSILTKLAAVKAFYHYCLEENLLKKNPTLSINSPKLDDSLPKFLTKRQMALLQELTKNNIRDRAIIETLFATGVRVSELLNIKIEDIKWETRQIWIRNGKGKKERFVLFTYECREWLQAYLNVRTIENEYLFGSPRGGKLSIVLIDRNFREFSDKLGFKVTPHMLRHTFATYLARKNMSQSFIQELLGHVNINTTSIYTRLTDAERKKQYDQFQ